jgi:hypothetical protein
LLISAATPTIRTAFPQRLAALPKLCSDPRCRSNPIAHRARRKRQRLPPSLLIENASVQLFSLSSTVLPEAFPIKASDNSFLEVIAQQSLSPSHVVAVVAV